VVDRNGKTVWCCRCCWNTRSYGAYSILVVAVRRLSRRWKMKTLLAGPSPRTTSPMRRRLPTPLFPTAASVIWAGVLANAGTAPGGSTLASWTQPRATSSCQCVVLRGRWPTAPTPAPRLASPFASGNGRVSSFSPNHVRLYLTVE